MADIDVVKKGSRTWLWILMAAIILFILWMVMNAGNQTQQTGGVLQQDSLPVLAAVHSAGTMV